MDKYGEYLYERFKEYNRTSDYEVDYWESRLANSVDVHMKNGDVIRYDDVTKTIKYCKQYDRDEYGDYTLTDDEYKDAFAANLGRIMASRRMSQKILSDNTGINTATINHYMRGRNLPDLRNILKICRALDCSVEDLTEFI